jgi:pilus assembly protein CpaB
MKNKRALIVMTIAILFGMAAVVFASRWLLNHPVNTSGTILVAASDISLGQRLTPEMFKQAEWPADSVPRGAFTDPQKLSGRVLKSNLLMGEPVSEVKLAPSGTLGGLSALITEGKRAITVRVNDVIGVAGFALPGNYVDIIVSTQKESALGPDAREQNISKIVLERILVLAVAQEVNRDETKPKVVNAVTLEVTPEQAEQLDLARSVGTLSLALRNQVDPAAAGTTGATKLSLLPQTSPAPVKVASRPAPVARPAPVIVKAAARDCVTVLNGLRKTQECF